MRIARWIGIGALAGGLALGWAKHFVHGQTGAVGTPTSAPAPAAPPRDSVDAHELQPQPVQAQPVQQSQYQLPPLPGATSTPTARSAPVTPTAPVAPVGVGPAAPTAPTAKSPNARSAPLSGGLPSPDIKIAPPTTGVEATAPRTAQGSDSTTIPGESRGKEAPQCSVEWVSPPSIRVNNIMPCQILVKNTGQVALHDVVVKHKLGAGVVCRQSEPPAFNDNGELIWTIGALQPGQARRVDLQLVAANRGEIHCHATATFTAASSHRVQVVEPKLAVKLTAPEKALPGDTVNVLVTVTNPGDGAADLVRIKAMLPEHLECVRGRLVEMDLGTLQPKAARTVQIACLARSSGAGKSTVAATADGNLTANDTAITEILEPKLDVAVVGPKLRYIDRHAVYTVKVSNPGTAPLQGVTVNQVVPAGFKFHEATGGGNFDPAIRTVAWQIPDLAPGQVKEVTVNLVATTAGDHRLIAKAASSRGIRSESALDTRVEGSSSLVIELVDLDDPIEVGAETAYEIRVSNAGTKTETNLIVTCTLPDSCELRSVKCTAGSKHKLEGKEVTFEPLARLAPKADVIYRVTVRGTAPGDARMRLRIRADGMPDPVLREESTRFYNDSMLQR
jgi:uncharacterized repeat protein (TIGR01451 family)